MDTLKTHFRFRWCMGNAVRGAPHDAVWRAAVAARSSWVSKELLATRVYVPPANAPLPPGLAGITQIGGYKSWRIESTSI